MGRDQQQARLDRGLPTMQSARCAFVGGCQLVGLGRVGGMDHVDVDVVVDVVVDVDVVVGLENGGPVHRHILLHRIGRG